ncbi:MAG: glutamine--fructose-6-phosphate transaminase (isomerizing) [Thermodesulfovibrionaceae bacterium]
MCGIIGYIGERNAVEVVLEGLKRLEYRGYDSAGIAYICNSSINTVKCKGKIRNLEALLSSQINSGQVAIGHTRWATHGKPSDENAHPHISGSIAVVHNGIIENYVELKKELVSEGYKFISETDTEVIAHLIDKYKKKYSFIEAIKQTCRRLKGSYALVVLDEQEPDKLVGVKMESPIVVGVNEGEKFIASDVPAFLNYCRNVIFLDDGEIVILTKDSYEITDLNGKKHKKEPILITWTASMAEKSGYKHFMLKEIYEQPRAVGDTIKGRVLVEEADIVYEEFGLTSDELKSIKKIYLVACGTSYHACLVGKYMIEDLAGVSVETEIASEFRYRKIPFEKNSLFLAISQSGETADTLAALKYAKENKVKTLSICNVLGSRITRESDYVFYTHSGPEIGVASTKAFTSQIVALYIFALGLAISKEKINKNKVRLLITHLMELPKKMEEALRSDRPVYQIAKEIYKKPNFLYLARGINYPIALEGALKLKEISYIHAEGYAAGEMKHGPIALVEDGFPVVFIVSEDSLFEKTIANIEEIKSRDGLVITLTNSRKAILKNLSDYFIYIKGLNKYLNTILFTLPLQLLAYYIADLRGCDVDQPRNLAKSVTVE